MSARATLHAAIADTLRADAGLEALAGVFDAPPVRASLPHAVVEEPLFADWSTKDMAGREGRIAVALYDGGERPGRLRGLAEAAENAVLGMDRELPGGWRIARAGNGWSATSEFRVRMLKES